jgi:hypothetical protein
VKATRVVWSLLATAGALCVGSHALAHHSFAMFDTKATLVLEGSVREFKFVNPHSYVQLMAPWGPKHKLTDWTLETSGPNYLLRKGWRKDSLKAGDKVKITIAPLRNGNPGGSILGVELADGRKMNMGGQ